MGKEFFMSKSVIEVLRERGFIHQESNPEGLQKILNKGPITCYAGFDPTAASLHIGSLVPIMALLHMQRAGHRVIAIVGGATALIGDPSGKTEMRSVMTEEQLAKNLAGIRQNLSQYLDFSDNKALLLNNYDWLKPLNYIDFLRDIGRHFFVNRMITQDSVKLRMERAKEGGEGLSFLEFNYSILQAFDFHHLAEHHHCLLQLGGSDQWGNITAGIDLARRLSQKNLYGVTFPLLTTASGEKMGKTAKGAVWLNGEMCFPYDFYQFWRNVEDNDVIRFLKLFTLLSLEEIEKLSKLQGEELNEAKKILAFEVTQMAHGEEKAKQAVAATVQLRENSEGDDSLIPTFRLPLSELQTGIPACILFERTGLCKSKSEAKRLLQQKGGYLNETVLEDPHFLINTTHLQNQILTLRSGKKKFLRIVPES